MVVMHYSQLTGERATMLLKKKKPTSTNNRILSPLVFQPFVQICFAVHKPWKQSRLTNNNKKDKQKGRTQ